ncbi:MAG: hypothetical protein M1817_003214 [Caeruleum heppii]|nr:MAG: hypothetical protein M1817_003214 [Caeruleum heppii]
MYTTKRKFHNLLDSLTKNKSSVSLPAADGRVEVTGDSSISDSSIQTKRRRISRPQSAVVRPRAASGDSADGLPRVTLHRTATGKARTETGPARIIEKADLPDFAPWDRSQFLRRLASFRHVDKWTAKPPPINEVQWAKRGWTCVSKERIGCGSCAKELCISLGEGAEMSSAEADITDGYEDDVDDAIPGAAKQLIERYSTMIVTEHDENCLWRRRGCDDAIYRLPLTRPATSLAALKERYQSLASMSSELPQNLSLPPSLDLDSLVDHLPRSFKKVGDLNNYGEEDDKFSTLIGKEAFALALFGWQAEKGHIEGLATCNACFRRLGLWLFRARAKDAANVEDEEDEAASMSRLDVIAEHRPYCPWVNATSQSSRKSDEQHAESGMSSGWETLVRVLHSQQHLCGESGRPSTRSGSPASGGMEDRMTTERMADKERSEDRTVRDAKDKERWAKLKRLRRMFDVKGGRKRMAKVQHLPVSGERTTTPRPTSTSE